MQECHDLINMLYTCSVIESCIVIKNVKNSAILDEAYD